MYCVGRVWGSTPCVEFQYPKFETWRSEEPIILSKLMVQYILEKCIPHFCFVFASGHKKSKVL